VFFERLALTWKIRRAQRLRDKNVQASFDALMEYALEEGEIPNKEQIGVAITSSVEANRAIDEYIAVLETDYWLEKAERTLLPTPKDDAFIRTKYYGQGVKRSFHYFDQETLSTLRSAVRKEEREQSEHFRLWASLALGIIGALIGLVAMLKK
jgi:hypothetical protein